MDCLAVIGAEEVLAAADDKLEQAIDETVGYHAGTHTPDKPLPHVYSHAVDAVIEEDYAHDDDYAYDEGAMFLGFPTSPMSICTLGAPPPKKTPTHPLLSNKTMC